MMWFAHNGTSTSKGTLHAGLAVSFDQPYLISKNQSLQGIQAVSEQEVYECH